MKKSTLSIYFAILFLISLFSFSACDLNAKYYKVSYKTEYGIPPEPIEVLAGSTLTMAQTARIKEDGQYCLGWYDGDVKVEAGKYVVNKDVTLVAKWQIKIFQISYQNYYNWVNSPDNVKSYTVNDEVILYDPLPREHYTFGGWFKSFDDCEKGEEKDKITKIEKGSTGNVTLYPKWIPIEYNITYILPENVKNNPGNPATYNIESATIYLQPAIAENLVFGGWYNNARYAGNEIEIIDYGSYGDVTLYGKCGISKTVKFVSSIGISEEGELTPLHVIEGTVLKESKIPVLTDWYGDKVLEGWYTSKDYKKDTKVIFGEYVVNTDITLYAKWVDSCNISYSLKDKIFEDISIPAGSYLIEEHLPIFHTNDKKISGWYTDENLSEESRVVAEKYQITKDIVLYPKWVSDSNLKNGKDKNGFVLVEGGLVHNELSEYWDWSGYFGNGNGYTLMDFLISPYEVTQELYTRVIGENPSEFKDNPAKNEVQEKRPVENVSFYDAIYFCNKYSILDGFTPYYEVSGNKNPDLWEYTPGQKDYIYGTIKVDSKADGYRLPTTMEWEYAARGGHINLQRKEFFAPIAGIDIVEYYVYLEEVSDCLDGYAWYWYNICNDGVSNLDKVRPEKTQNGYGTHEVGKLKPNALGLYDMSGNVWEWMFNIDQLNFVEKENSDTATIYMSRCGGAWNTNAWYCRITDSNSIYANLKYNGIGFRLVRNCLN